MSWYYDSLSKTLKNKGFEFVGFTEFDLDKGQYEIWKTNKGLIFYMKTTDDKEQVT